MSQYWFRDLTHLDKMRQSVILFLVFLSLNFSKSHENHSKDANSKKIISHGNIFERKSEIRSLIKTILRGRSLKSLFQKQFVEGIFPPSKLCRKHCHFDRKCGKCVHYSMFNIACNKRLCLYLFYFRKTFYTVQHTNW